MFYLSKSEFLFYSGITVMAASAVLAAGCITAFLITWRKLKEKLEKEYGRLKY